MFKSLNFVGVSHKVQTYSITKDLSYVIAGFSGCVIVLWLLFCAAVDPNGCNWLWFYEVGCCVLKREAGYILFPLHACVLRVELFSVQRDAVGWV